jgi:hypothetical protein
MKHFALEETRACEEKEATTTGVRRPLVSPCSIYRYLLHIGVCRGGKIVE